MADESDEYRKHAIYCYEMADKDGAAFAKAGWLRLAKAWLELANDKAAATSAHQFPQQNLPRPRH